MHKYLYKHRLAVPTIYIFIYLFFYYCSMARIISFCMIAEFFKDNMKQLSKGENAYNSGYVKNMIFDPEVSPAVLRGSVQASMKNKLYKVEVIIAVIKRIILFLSKNVIFVGVIKLRRWHSELQMFLPEGSNNMPPFCCIGTTRSPQ